MNPGPFTPTHHRLNDMEKFCAYGAQMQFGMRLAIHYLRREFMERGRFGCTGPCCYPRTRVDAISQLRNFGIYL